MAWKRDDSGVTRRKSFVFGVGRGYPPDGIGEFWSGPIRINRRIADSAIRRREETSDPDASFAYRVRSKRKALAQRQQRCVRAHAEDASARGPAC